MSQQSVDLCSLHASRAPGLGAKMPQPERVASAFAWPRPAGDGLEVDYKQFNNACRLLCHIGRERSIMARHRSDGERWHLAHSGIVLASISPESGPIVLMAKNEEDVRVIAELAARLS